MYSAFLDAVCFLEISPIVLCVMCVWCMGGCMYVWCMELCVRAVYECVYMVYL